MRFIPPWPVAFTWVMTLALPLTSYPVMASEPVQDTSQIRRLFESELADLYCAEKRMHAQWRVLADRAKSDDLQEFIAGQRHASQDVLVRLQDVYMHLGRPTAENPCQGFEGLVSAMDAQAGVMKDSPLLDFILIESMRQLNQHRSVAYFNLIVLAQHLDEPDIEELLRLTLDDAENADQQLISLMKRSLSPTY